MSYGESQVQLRFPRPGRVLRVVLVLLFAIWLSFAIGLNWAGAPEAAFFLFCGSTEKILNGEIFRLLTAPLMHLPVDSIWHIVSALLGLYFLGAPLEEAWGGARFARFLALAAVFAYAVQMAAELILPESIAGQLIGTYWFGSIPVVEAVAIAWALSFRGQVIQLFLVLPVSSRGLILFVVGTSLLWVVIAAKTPSGLIAPFGGMLAGWLFGGGTPSPARRAWLKLRLARLDAEARREGAERRSRIAQSHLRALPPDEDGPPPSSDPGSGSGDKWLN